MASGDVGRALFEGVIIDGAKPGVFRFVAGIMDGVANVSFRWNGIVDIGACAGILLCGMGAGVGMNSGGANGTAGRGTGDGSHSA